MVRWLLGSVVILLVSSALVWLVTARPGGVASGSDLPTLLGITSARVEAIEVRRPQLMTDPAAASTGSGSAAVVGARVFRSGLTGGMPAWLIRDLPSVDPQTETPVSSEAVARATWPADDARVRAAIRVLQSTELFDPQPVDRADDRVPLATLVVSQAGEEVVIEFLDRPLLGRSPVRVTRADGLVIAASLESSVYDAFVQTGVRAWGVPFLLLPAASGPSRIEVVSDLNRGEPDQREQRLGLVRRANTWRLTSPFSAPADAQTVAGLISVLGRAKVGSEALSDPESLDTRFASRPIATISVHAERPGTGDVWTQVIELGEPADLGAQSLLVRVRSSVGSRQLWGPRVLRLPVDTFASVSADANRYVSLTPSDMNRAAVGGVRLLGPPSLLNDNPEENLPGLGGSYEYRLIGNTWYAMRGDARKPAPEGDAAAVAGLVRALTEGTATEVAFVPAPEQSPRVMLLDTLHQPAQVFRLWIDPTTSAIYVSASELRWTLTPTSETDLVHVRWLEGLLATLEPEEPIDQGSADSAGESLEQQGSVPDSETPARPTPEPPGR